ncbi:MAG: HAMP domain-containing sensor histidine kinase [Actinomycetota bacterium]
MSRSESGGLRTMMFGGRNLRRRIAVAVGLFTTIAVVVFGTVVWVLVARSLQTAIDADLEATAELVEAVGDGAQDLDPDDGAGPFADGIEQLETTGDGRPPVPYIQVVTGGGTVLGGSELFGVLPVTEGARSVASGNAARHVETLTIADRRVRVLTVPVDLPVGTGALQVGTDATNTFDGLQRARTGTLLAGLSAGLGAAAMAWLFSRRLVAPVRAVAEAADRLRQDRELPDRLVGEGPDELGRLVTSFNGLLDDLRDSRRRQRQLVADASHELRTPLTSLRLKIEFIQSEPDLDPDARQRLVAGAVADLTSLGDLVSELIELAAEGNTQERATLTDLGELVTAEADRFATTSGRAVTVSTTSGVVETKPNQVTRAFTNLLVNADKYSPDGLPIEVIQAGPRIEVRDHGPGIPAGERGRVFDRFYRGRGHQSIEGSGLGLAIVESMATANGGTTWIADPADGGDGVVVGFSVGPTLDPDQREAVGEQDGGRGDGQQHNGSEPSG